MLRTAFLVLLLTMAVVSGATEVKAKRKMPSNRNGHIMNILAQVAEETGVPLDWLTTFANIESSFDPNSNKGKRTQYKGLFNMSRAEFRRGGGKGDIYDPIESAHSFANLLKAKSRAFERQMGRPPTKDEFYMMHQQGEAGAKAHLQNPEGIAWKNIRRYYESDSMAKRAVWGNVPGPLQRRFRKAGMGVDDITSRQFTQMWADKTGRESREVADYEMTPPTPSRGERGTDSAESYARQQQNLPGNPEQARSRADDRQANSGWTPRLENVPPPPASPSEPRVARREEGEGAAAAPSPNNTEWIDKAFGAPFGDLYKNELEVPPAPPLFKDLFGR